MYTNEENTPLPLQSLPLLRTFDVHLPSAASAYSAPGSAHVIKVPFLSLEIWL